MKSNPKPIGSYLKKGPKIENTIKYIMIIVRTLQSKPAMPPIIRDFFLQRYFPPLYPAWKGATVKKSIDTNGIRIKGIDAANIPRIVKNPLIGLSLCSISLPQTAKQAILFE
jgi:hypothetical protein